MSPPDDSKRTVTVTVAKLKAFEGAVHARESQRYRKQEAWRLLDAAKLEYERAVLAESDAIDVEIAATNALHGTDASEPRSFE